MIKNGWIKGWQEYASTRVGRYNFCENDEVGGDNFTVTTVQVFCCPSRDLEVDSLSSDDYDVVECPYSFLGIVNPSQQDSSSITSERKLHRVFNTNEMYFNSEFNMMDHKYIKERVSKEEYNSFKKGFDNASETQFILYLSDNVQEVIDEINKKYNQI